MKPWYAVVDRTAVWGAGRLKSSACNDARRWLASETVVLVYEVTKDLAALILAYGHSNAALARVLAEGRCIQTTTLRPKRRSTPSAGKKGGYAGS